MQGGGIDKEQAGIPDDVKVRPGQHESMCNPIVQARILNREGTDLNVIVGLCVGTTRCSSSIRRRR